MNNKKLNINIIIQNKHHLLALLFISFYYFFCLILFDQIIINPHDNLDISVVNEHVVANIIRGDLDSANNFLSGEIKWFYIEEIFFPFNLAYLFLSDKSSYFIFEIIKKILSYFTFYILAKHLQKDKFSNTLSSILYSTLINSEKVFGFGMVMLPYFLYLIIKKNKLRLKHIFIIIIFSLNSSLVRDYLAILMMFPLALILKPYNRNYKVFLSFYLTSFIAFLVASAPVILSLIDIGETHRNEILSESNNLIDAIKLQFHALFNINIFEKNAYLSIFFLLLILFSTFNFTKKKIFFLGILLFIIILFSPIIDDIIDSINFPNEFKFIGGFNFNRINRIVPLISSILFLYNLSFLKYFFKKFLLFFSIIVILFVTFSIPTREVLRSFFYFSLPKEEYLTLKESVKQNLSLIEFIKYFYQNYNFKDKSNYKLNLASNYSFENYYKFDSYKKIKSIVKNNRVMSIGIDPMIAVMNDLKVIDGYHTMYPLSYKKKFREIIKPELDINPTLKSYYDTFGSRVYIFFTDQNNILINFKAAKEIGANFVISSFAINNENLKENLKLPCSYCNLSKELYLYRIL